MIPMSHRGEANGCSIALCIHVPNYVQNDVPNDVRNDVRNQPRDKSSSTP
jgi:hypothetical protein